MDSLHDGVSSPRRGSLNSLHRQSSGSSFSHNSKLASPGSGNNSLTTNQNNTSHFKDIDKFTRYFIIKTVQVIVQSRIGGNKKLKTECKPSGNDWFNINISDIAEVSEKTKAALDYEGFSVKSNWRVCCEISLRTLDGGCVVLEHWIISNKSIQAMISSKINSNQGSPKSPQSNRISPVPLSTSNSGASPISANTNVTTTRLRTATFSNTMRTRLNSIDDSPGDKNFLVNKHLVGTNNENFDFKSSTSCYSLSNSPANQMSDHTNMITTSPSINSLTSNLASEQMSTNSTANNNSASQSSKTNAISSIYTTYNRMSLLLKTLMTTTHIVPAYRLASRTSQVDSCVICYRVYTCPSSYQGTKVNSLMNKGSLEDINYNLSSDSPNKRSTSSNSSYGSLNIRDFVGPDELDHFCPILKLGSIKTEINELDVSVCYRTDVKNSSQLLKSPRLRDMYNKILDEDCILAAKQLLAGNEYTWDSEKHEDNHSVNEAQCQETLDHLNKPLRPAFAAIDNTSKIDFSAQDPALEIVESAFDGLLKIKKFPVDNQCGNKDNPKNEPIVKHQQNGSLNAQSEPIQVPSAAIRVKQQELYPNLSSGSTPKSLTDSFVFVDLNPPFASEEQNDINSFFHGPSPAFSNGFDSLKDVDELTNQLADIEANASQLDEFVDNICMSEEEEEEEEEEN